MTFSKFIIYISQKIRNSRETLDKAKTSRPKIISMPLHTDNFLNNDCERSYVSYFISYFYFLTYKKAWFDAEPGTQQYPKKFFLPVPGTHRYPKDFSGRYPVPIRTQKIFLAGPRYPLVPKFSKFRWVPLTLALLNE